ncbi:GNAT family N-acetyltransferase [Gracilibacillus caseinilyticus]|uniref:GNAT family N-acetyltransferase n=1 Tax=Gracilibacillus caseinilyticus TaxID=2932256 RepID=A0ABY4EQZ5_9BACI|nr:GNAT family N-acetyltransferase [Gracilibacillus caseinilyticus]UOQ46855.1 GNAT family N-acetyltransferase [Gracilibacillus caseinilyticus]
MSSYQIIKLAPSEFYKCSNIWDMTRQAKMAEIFLEELVNGNRITFVYVENHQFIGECSLVFRNNDPDYTIPNKRIYLSRMIVKDDFRNRGIGSILLDYLIEFAIQLGYEEISLGVDTNNWKAMYLYHKKGFTHELYTGKDEHGEYVKLLKKLR